MFVFGVLENGASNGRWRRNSECYRIVLDVSQIDEGRFLRGRRMTAQTVKTKTRVRIIDGWIVRLVARRVIRPVPTIEGRLAIFDHHRPAAQLRILFGGIAKHLFDDNRAVGNLALAISLFEPVPGFGRIENLDGVMRAERLTHDKRAGITDFAIRDPVLVATLFKKCVESLLKSLRADLARTRQRKSDVALGGGPVLLSVARQCQGERARQEQSQGRSFKDGARSHR